MTDKQIIIDGVDVSKCIYFQQEDDEYTCGAEECNGAIVACRACDNCYYKQLKRSEAQCEAMFVSHTDLEKAFKAKEQECEELKEECRKYGKINEQETKDYAELEAENERLKKEIRLYNCIDKWGTKECHCACRCLGNDFCDDADKKIKQLEAENEKLKKDVKRWKSNFNSKVSVIEELIKIIQQAIKDFSIEVGTPQYDRLLENTKALGIGVKDYE